MKLFCIPYAGGYSTAYTNLKKNLQNNIEVIPIELLGRGFRSNGKFYENFDEAVEDIYITIKQNISDGKSYSILGHSMGSWLAYEVSKKIITDDSFKEKPKNVFFSGNYAPHINCSESEVYKLDDDDLWEYIYSLGGTSKIIYENEECKNFYIPILRADYKIIDNYNNKKKEIKKLNFNITVLCGKEDKLREKDLNEWSIYAAKNFNIKWFSGDHFYISDNSIEISNYIKDILS